ncbi:MAG: molybdopterin converting factor subunit 1 [Candidatus Accumulibacter sp.]|uniref:molybdopterin converting factor subunit 1 n=1 Tax=Accumulibacter sp. TaxID=2053492 RepID=UPI00287A2C15|nr:molybdopterin converting factor subunit 1 [Accumulibacter sp.]MDS4013093.1 molybdopterin converting factor subunit 1 [Accumulibacter sp.]
MLRILYFAGLREQLATNQEDLPLPTGVHDVAGLLAFLAARGGDWQHLQRTRNLRCAVNQEMASFDCPLRGDEELAFFPPVTGG